MTATSHARRLALTALLIPIVLAVGCGGSTPPIVPDIQSTTPGQITSPATDVNGDYGAETDIPDDDALTDETDSDFPDDARADDPPTWDGDSDVTSGDSIDPTPERLDGSSSDEFEPDDIDRAEDASDEVRDYCAGAVSEAQYVGCLSHVSDDDIP